MYREPPSSQRTANNILVKVESRFNQGLIVSCRDPNTNIELRGALLPCNKSSSSQKHIEQRLISKDCVIHLSKSAIHNHPAYNTTSSTKPIEDVTKLPPKGVNCFGIQSREMKKLSFPPQNSCTILCDRAPVPPAWLLTPEEFSTNSKYRTAKYVARRKLNDQINQLQSLSSFVKERRTSTNKQLIKKRKTRLKIESSSRNCTTVDSTHSSMNHILLNDNATMVPLTYGKPSIDYTCSSRDFTYRPKMKNFSIPMQRIVLPTKEEANPSTPPPTLLKTESCDKQQEILIPTLHKVEQLSLSKECDGVITSLPTFQVHIEPYDILQ